jgi:hypothetical protein
VWAIGSAGRLPKARAPYVHGRYLGASAATGPAHLIAGGRAGRPRPQVESRPIAPIRAIGRVVGRRPRDGHPEPRERRDSAASHEPRSGELICINAAPAAATYASR